MTACHGFRCLLTKTCCFRRSIKSSTWVTRWVSIATPVTSPKGGQFVLHAKALHGNPFDGHTLGPVVADMEKLTGVEARRIHVDKGYRGNGARAN
ncbi:hypothetical protein ACVIGB_008048 [Bradyrhizobium sp. USDA 4341]